MKKLYEWARRNGVPVNVILALKQVLTEAAEEDEQIVEKIPFDGDLETVLKFLEANQILTSDETGQVREAVKAAAATPKADSAKPAAASGQPDLEAVREKLRRENRAKSQPASARPAPAAATPKADPSPKAKPAAPAVSGFVDAIRDRLPDSLSGFVNGKTLLIAGAALLVVIILAAMFLFGGGDKSAAESIASESAIPTATTTPPAGGNDGGTQLDSDWWNRTLKAKVTERSPMRLGHLNQLGIVAQVLGFGLLLWMWADLQPRKKSQKAVALVAILASLAGLLTVPLLNMVYKDTGNTFIVSMVLLVLWAAPVYGVLTHYDNTALVVSLSLFALTLFDIGHFDFPAGLAPIFKARWTAWEGITSIGGWLQLVSAFRFGEAALTTLMFVAMIGAVIAASHEVGKKYKGWVGALIAGLVMLVLWVAFNWVLGQGVIWLANTQQPTQTVLFVLEILRPLLAWLISMGIATLIGTSLGDLEVEWGQNKVKLGLGGSSSGGWSATTADFAVLATVFALFGILVLVL